MNQESSFVNISPESPHDFLMNLFQKNLSPITTKSKLITRDHLISQCYSHSPKSCLTLMLSNPIIDDSTELKIKNKEFAKPETVKPEVVHAAKNLVFECLPNHRHSLSCSKLIQVIIEIEKTNKTEANEASDNEINKISSLSNGLDPESILVLPAEQDGTVMTDLPSFSKSTDLLNTGVTDYLLINKTNRAKIMHVTLTEDFSQPTIDASIPGNNSSELFFDRNPTDGTENELLVDVSELFEDPLNRFGCIRDTSFDESKSFQSNRELETTHIKETELSSNIDEEDIEDIFQFGSEDDLDQTTNSGRDSAEIFDNTVTLTTSTFELEENLYAKALHNSLIKSIPHINTSPCINDVTNADSILNSSQAIDNNPLDQDFLETQVTEFYSEVPYSLRSSPRNRLSYPPRTSNQRQTASPSFCGSNASTPRSSKSPMIKLSFRKSDGPDTWGGTRTFSMTSMDSIYEELDDKTRRMNVSKGADEGYTAERKPSFVLDEVRCDGGVSTGQSCLEDKVNNSHKIPINDSLNGKDSIKDSCEGWDGTNADADYYKESFHFAEFDFVKDSSDSFQTSSSLVVSQDIPILMVNSSSSQNRSQDRIIPSTYGRSPHVKV